jgi:hypothetical protein
MGRLSPKVSAGAGTILEMVESLVPCDGDLAAGVLSNEMCCDISPQMRKFFMTWSGVPKIGERG